VRRRAHRFPQAPRASDRPLDGRGRGRIRGDRRLQGKNWALAESERSLERKVAERTAELERKNEELEDSRLQLAEANRAKSAFLASMSHELRTPLNAVIGYSEMVQEEAQESGRSDLVPDLEKILTSGRYLLSLINDVLDLSKIEAGKMEVFLETFDVASLVDGVATTIDPLIRRNANALDVRKPDALGTMHSDETKIGQILFNLLSNASKFTHEGTVRLDVAREQRGSHEWIAFSVSDSGIGMTPEQLDRVFDAFAQAEASTTRQYGGTGLGLSITRQFCEMLGGMIHASSEPGRGSRFEVRLPSQAPSPDPSS
jgi:signal transduction histidine kinase